MTQPEDFRASSVLFVNRYFHPDHSASSQILSDLAFYLAGEGSRVRVIASRQIYDDPAIVLPDRETVQGVEIVRVRTTHFGRHSSLGRIVDYLSFYFVGAFALLRHAARGDIVVVKTDPPLLSVLAGCIARLRGFKIVNWLQDLYPEVAQQLGVAGLNSVMGRWLVGLRNQSLRRAAMNVVIDEDMAVRVRAASVNPDRLAVVRNWTEDEQIAPLDPGPNPLRKAWGLEGKFVVAYSGNLGRAHDYETILAAGEALRDRRDIVFLFIGGGNGLARLSDEVKKRALANFQFQPYQPRETLAFSLGVADLHWLSLKPELRGLIFPSKFYGIAAAGRPILFIGASEGELPDLIAGNECGVAVRPGCGEELARTIVGFCENRERCRQYGANARRMLETRFTKARALEAWRSILQRVANASSEA